MFKKRDDENAIKARIKANIVKDMLLIVVLFSIIFLAGGFILAKDLKQSYLCRQEGYNSGFVDMLGEPYCIHKTKSGRTIEVQYKGIMKDKGL